MILVTNRGGETGAYVLPFFFFFGCTAQHSLRGKTSRAGCAQCYCRRVDSPDAGAWSVSRQQILNFPGWLYASHLGRQVVPIPCGSWYEWIFVAVTTSVVFDVAIYVHWSGEFVARPALDQTGTIAWADYPCRHWKRLMNVILQYSPSQETQ